MQDDCFCRAAIGLTGPYDAWAMSICQGAFLCLLDRPKPPCPCLIPPTAPVASLGQRPLSLLSADTTQVSREWANLTPRVILNSRLVECCIDLYLTFGFCIKTRRLPFASSAELAERIAYTSNAASHDVQPQYLTQLSQITSSRLQIRVAIKISARI